MVIKSYQQLIPNPLLQTFFCLTTEVAATQTKSSLKLRACAGSTEKGGKLTGFSITLLSLALFLGLVMSTFLPATAKSLSPEQQPLSPRGELLAQRRRRARLRFKVPNIRSSRNLSAAAARGYCGIEGAKDIQMKALLPNTHIGLTTSEKPTFFFHVSPTSIREAKFLLLDAEGKTILYKRIFALAKTGGVISFTLPADAKVLEVGQEYTWELAVLCDPDDQRGNPNVQGSIKRIEPSQKLANDLGKTPLYEHIALYANEGLWYDMLKTLADLRSCNPNDSTLVSDWKELLSSAGLSSINQEPLLQSCMSNQK